MSARENLKLLLLQIRHNPKVRAEEHQSFADYSGLDVGQIDVLNVFDRPDVPADAAEGYDGLFVGGASEASVLEPERFPFIEPCTGLLRRCIDRRTPVFASCFGFQLAVVALDGTIQRDEGDFEMGTVPISLTEAARADPIFTGVSDGFLAVSVHRERATRTPSGCETLARTDSCIHSFRVRGAPFWTFQFHPEVDRSRLVERLTIFKEHYTRGDDHLDEVLSSARETPESNGLVASFVQRVLLC